MAFASLPPDILNLEVAERIELATAIWDSVAAEPSPIQLSPQQKAELDRRLAARDEQPDAGDSWENVKQRILGE